jgi:hypothetical protein
MRTATPNMAYQAAETAHGEVSRLTLTIQQLLDAVRRGQTITVHDMEVLHVDCRVLAVSVAQTFHAIAHVPHERRALEADHA